MNKTPMLLAVALVATAVVTTLPSPARETNVDTASQVFTRSCER
jgi:hypothetical protein